MASKTTFTFMSSLFVCTALSTGQSAGSITTATRTARTRGESTRQTWTVLQHEWTESPRIVVKSNDCSSIFHCLSTALSLSFP